MENIKNLCNNILNFKFNHKWIFLTPSITTDSFIYYIDFTSDQSNALVWQCSNLYVALHNENTANSYPEPATSNI